LDVCKDKKSEGFYRKVAQIMPSDVIYRTLSEVKEIRDLVGIKRNEGALFTNLIKNHAQELGIDL
jgi:hypothetical protein